MNADNERRTYENRMKTLKQIAYFIIWIAVILLCAWGVRKYIFQRSVIDGSSMETAFSDGESVIIDEISYRFKDPERYDVVVFPYRYENDTYYVKRIIGLPGEKVQIADGQVYINDEPLASDTYCDELIEDPGQFIQPVVLGEDEYVVLGDNRNHSHDSREKDVGILKKSDFIGKAVLRIWPLDRFGFV